MYLNRLRPQLLSDEELLNVVGITNIYKIIRSEMLL